LLHYWGRFSRGKDQLSLINRPSDVNRPNQFSIKDLFPFIFNCFPNKACHTKNTIIPRYSTEQNGGNSCCIWLNYVVCRRKDNQGCVSLSFLIPQSFCLVLFPQYHFVSFINHYLCLTWFCLMLSLYLISFSCLHFSLTYT
jgi:hypothetical protein